MLMCGGGVHRIFFFRLVIATIDVCILLTYVAPPYLCELINKKERHVITRLGTDHHQLIMPPISKDCSNTFLERSFIYTAPC